MSNLIYPVVRGLQPEIVRTPLTSTVIKTASSGKEIRNQKYAKPRYKFSLNYGYLKDYDNSGLYAPNSDFRQLLGFFNDRAGDFDSFFFNDPDDVMDNLPAGDGATTVFTTQRNYNGRGEDPDSFQFIPVILQGVGGSMENLCPFSTQFDSSAWIKAGVTVTSNTIANPVNGAVDGDTLTPTTTTGTVEQTPIYTMSTAMPFERGFTFSVYLKAVTTNQSVNLYVFDSHDGLNNAGQGTFAINTSTWTRISVSYTPTAGAHAAGATIHLQLGGIGGYITTATGAIYASCAQVERQLAVSPWITNGVGAAQNTYVFALASGSWKSTFTVAPANAVQLVYGAPNVPLYRVRFDLADMNNGEFDLTAIFNNLHSASVDLIQVNA